jgi:hypothetical protein
VAEPIAGRLQTCFCASTGNLAPAATAPLRADSRPVTGEDQEGAVAGFMDPLSGGHGTDDAGESRDAEALHCPRWRRGQCGARNPGRRSSQRASATGTVGALLAAKDHVNLFLYDGAIIPDPDGIITGRHNNKTARTIAFKQGETINAQALTAMLKQIIANNRAGGWDKLKKP